VNRHVFFLLLSALLWSLGGVLIKSIHWTPLGIAGTRSIVAIVLMSALSPSLFRQVSWQALPGALAYSATVVLFVVATKITTAANAIFLQYTAPIYIAALSPWYLRERTRWSDWIFILVATSGVALFFLDRLGFTGLWGVLAALASGLSFAWMTMILRRQRDSSPEAVLYLGNIVTALLAIPWILQEPSGLWRNAPGLLVLGIFQLTLPYLIYARAIRHVRALDAALVSMIEPILNPFWVMLVTSEKPAPWSLVGGSLVLGSAFFRSIVAARTKADPAILPAPEAVGRPE
jgi:drug/metabolite transporter (DMT)-like permease